MLSSCSAGQPQLFLSTLQAGAAQTTEGAGQDTQLSCLEDQGLTTLPTHSKETPQGEASWHVLRVTCFLTMLLVEVAPPDPDPL